MVDSIEFIAEVIKVQTRTDNAIRITLDLPETAIEQMAMLAECQRQGIVLKVKAYDLRAGKEQE